MEEMKKISKIDRSVGRSIDWTEQFDVCSTETVAKWMFKPFIQIRLGEQKKSSRRFQSARGNMKI